MSPWAALQVAVVFGVPALLLALERRATLPGWLSPVVVSYALGVALGNVGAPLEPGISEQVVIAAVLLGIPLLIVSADFLAWLRLAKTTAVACALSFLSVCGVTALSAAVFASRVEEGDVIAGMLVGTYTGSAPNMVAVAHALEASPETLVLVTTADLIVAGAFCFLLLSPLVRRLGAFLPAFEPLGEGLESEAPEPQPGRALLGQGVGSLTFGVVAVALAGGVSLLVPKSGEQLAAILAVTSLGIAGSFVRPLRALRTSYPLGIYFILVFCVGFGSLADVRRLLGSESSGLILLWAAAVLLASVGLHLLLCRLAKIDRDTALITLTAALYGPPLIGPVAANLGNRELVLSGVTAALFGLAVGNYLGVGVALAVRALS